MPTAGLYDISFQPSTGTRVYVCPELPDIPVDWGDDEDLKYVKAYKAFEDFDIPGKFTEIYNIVDAGDIGGAWEGGSEAKLADGKRQKWKTVFDAGNQSLTYGETPADPGQKLLTRISRRTKLAAFKMVKSNGVINYYAAHVMGVPTTVSTSTNYLSVNTSLDITDEVYSSVIYNQIKEELGL